MTGYRNARAGAWTLRQHVPEDGKPAVGGIAMPAQGLGRCDLRKTMRTLPPGCYRNARAGALTLRQMPRHLVAQRHDDIAMPAQGLGRCDRAYACPCTPSSKSQCPRRGLDAATINPAGNGTVLSQIAMPAQGLGRCDTPRRMASVAGTMIAMPAQGLGRCDVSRGTQRLGEVDYRNARAGAWTLRHRPSRPSASSRPDRNARAGAWTLRPMGVHARDPELPGIAKMRQPALSSKLEMTGSPHNPLLSLPLASLPSHPQSSCQP